MATMNTPFVGRARELESLGLALSEADQYAGRFVAIAGEPGMGKTRILTEFSDSLRAQDRQVLWSQMIEDPGAPAYFSWTLALRGLVQQCTDATLASDLGAGAATVAHIIPELADRLDLAAEPELPDSASAHNQLSDSVTRFLVNVAGHKPLVLLFDNLHLADRSALALLDYFCQQIANHPILVVGAYRDSELGRRHPLRPVLNQLSRSTGFTRLVLDGLSRTEAAELLHAHLGEAPPAPLVDAVHDQSGGNPLFVNEVAGMLARQMSRRSLPGPGFHFKVPDSLREVITTRLDQVPAETSRLLGIAAVLGREFHLAGLAELSSARENQVPGILQAAESANIITLTGPGRYQFHHVLFREVLYAEHNTITRVMLHRRAGEQLERRYRDDPAVHVSQLAHHFFESAQAGSQHKAMSYCRQAAEDAMARHAFDQAAALFDCALQAAELAGEPETEARFGLLLTMGQALHHSGQLNAANQTLLKAAILAFHHDWWERLANALLVFQLVCQQSGYRHVASVPLHQAALENLSGDDTALRARLLASLALAWRTAAEPEQAMQAFQDGIALARESGDPQVLLDCLLKGNWSIGRQPANLQQGLEISMEALLHARQLKRPDAELNALADSVFQLCDLGRINEARQYMAMLRELAQEQRHPHFLNVLAGFETAVAILQGNWQEAVQRASQAVRQVPLLGVLGLEGRFAFQIFAIKKAQGSLGEVAELAGQIIDASHGEQLWLPGQILLHCELGQRQQARDALDQLGDPRDLPGDDLRAIALVYLAEASTMLRDMPRCTDLYALLKPYRGLNATLAGTLMLGSVAAYLAILAMTLRRYGEARELFEEALEENRAMGAQPALARTQVDFARLLLRGDHLDDHARARRLMGEARVIATNLELRPVLTALDELQTGAGADSLTRRELDVLRLIANGSSNRRIADSLHISHSTVATHIRNIFRKTGVANRTEAVDFARCAALLDQD